MSTAQTMYQAISDDTSHTYRFYSVGVDSRGNTESAPGGPTDDVHVSAQFAAPPALDVTAFDVQKGANQRSYIRYLDILFNTEAGLQDILDSVNDGDSLNDRVTLRRFELDGSGSGDTVGVSGVIQRTGASLQFDFGTNGLTGDPNSSAGNGYYELALDLDGNGSLETELHFYRLLGDTNGDRKVSQKDVQNIRKGIRRNLFNSDNDINGDGKVDIFDLLFAKEEKTEQLLQSLILDD